MFIIIRKKQIAIVFTVAIMIAVLLSAINYIVYLRQSANIRNASGNHPKYFISIYIDEKKLFLFQDGICIKKYPIASGKPGWPSPIGQWKIVNKGDWGEGFGGRWMGLNVPWGTYGIHGTTREGSIGRAASHGCIRMFNKHVKELYDIVPIGTPVSIRNGPFGPFGTGFKELLPGDRGADVLAVQQKLASLGYFKGYASGIYEDSLKHALHKFQKDRQLQVKDGITREDYSAMGFQEFE